MGIKYELICKESDKIDEANDCTVKALAIATGMPYLEAHEMMRVFGRKNRRASHGYDDVLQSLDDFTAERVDIRRNNGRQYTPKSIAQALPKGRFICQTSGHVFALVDGVVEDWTKNRCHRIKWVWVIVDREKEDLESY